MASERIYVIVLKFSPYVTFSGREIYKGFLVFRLLGMYMDGPLFLSLLSSFLPPSLLPALAGGAKVCSEQGRVHEVPQDTPHQTTHSRNFRRQREGRKHGRVAEGELSLVP